MRSSPFADGSLEASYGGVWAVVSGCCQLWLHLALPIPQTVVAAGLSWYLTHAVLGHRQPFFALVAAAVCVSASRVLRGQRAVQMVLGVRLGIGLGRREDHVRASAS